MTPILYEKDDIDFTSQGLGSLVEIYDVDVAEQRNGLLQLTASYPVTGVRYDDISVGRIILAKPNQRDEPHAFRITSTDLDIMGHNVMIEADSITYDLNHNIVKHLNVSGADGQTMMSALKNAIVNPSIFNFYSDITHVSSTSLDYVNPMEAVMGVKGSFLQIWGGELKRENRRVAMFNRRGHDNVATFRLGKNISGLKYKVDISSLVTRILPIKSVQENDTTTYLEGTPVSSQYINSYEQIYTIKVDFTDDTIKTVDDLNNAAAKWFVESANTGRDKPSVAIDIDVLSLQDSADYQDKFKDLESVALTDTVTVYVPEYGINVTAIVNELHFDPIQERVTKLTVGTAKQSFADSSRTQLSDLQDKIISVQNQADATAVSANGKSTNYYGSVEPAHPQEGDTWFWVDGDKSGIKVFVNGDWVEPVDSDTQEKIATAGTDAVTQAKAYSDQLVADNVAQVNTVLDDVQAKQADLTAQQAELDTKAQGYANKALADAKADTLATATQTAKDAQEYTNTAKAEAISAATKADGVINQKIDDTASSITRTISQNKSDADGKISTAQSTATQALNGLATKVSQTDYNAKTGQLQTDLNTTTTTANKATTEIASIKSDNTKQDTRMTTIESDASGTKTTVSNLQTDLGKANGSITTLQQRADGFDATVTKVNNLSVGSRNYILKSSYALSGSGSSYYDSWYSSIPISKLSNNVITISAQFDYDSITSPSNQKRMGFEVAATKILPDGTRKDIYFNIWVYPALGSSFHGRKSSTYDLTNTSIVGSSASSPKQWFGGLYIQGVIGDGVSISNPKIEIGNVATDWTPAPEDTDNKISTVSQTVDNISSIVSDPTTGLTKRIQTAEGSISTVQSNVSDLQSQQTQTANGLTTEISNRATGDTNTLTQAKDFTTSSISNSESGMKSLITQTSDSIIAKVDTKTDSATVLSLLKDNWSIGIADNAGALASGIAGDLNGMTLISKKITLDGDTTVTGDFYAKGGNFKNIDASNITVGTLNGTQVNITNINANNIVSGSISGANLNINLNTGQVVFQRGRIYNASVEATDYTKGGIDINIDKRYLASSNGSNVAMLYDGKLSLIQEGFFTGPTSVPYFEISNHGGGFDFDGAALTATEKLLLTTKGDVGNLGLIDGRYLNGIVINKTQPTRLGGLGNGVIISGGQGYSDTKNVFGYAPHILVGVDQGAQSTSEIHMYSSWIRASAVEERTTSAGANVNVASDGTLVRSSSSSKYKLDIEYEQQADTANKLLTLDPATWHDKFESKQLDKFHKIGVDPEIAIDMSNRRYYGIIAEDLVKAGLEHLVSRNVMTGEVEGVEYSKIGVALIPIIRDLRNRLNDQYVEIERLKEQLT